MTPLVIDKLEIVVDLEKGPVGMAVLKCTPTEGQVFNTQLLECALEHTSANCNGCETDVLNRLVVCRMPVSQDDTDEILKLHLVTQFEGIMAGAVDWAADLGESIFSDCLPEVDLHVEIYQGLNS